MRVHKPFKPNTVQELLNFEACLAEVNLRCAAAMKIKRGLELYRNADRGFVTRHSEGARKTTIQLFFSFEISKHKNLQKIQKFCWNCRSWSLKWVLGKIAVISVQPLIMWLCLHVDFCFFFLNYYCDFRIMEMLKEKKNKTEEKNM